MALKDRSVKVHIRKACYDGFESHGYGNGLYEIDYLDYCMGKDSMGIHIRSEHVSATVRGEKDSCEVTLMVDKAKARELAHYLLLFAGVIDEKR